MSYTVLARQWRPKNFAQLVGQQHVMQALSNALDQQRLHHAYLFTGTRGVGKTTIARIFAKALNCEQGITSKPCGECDACRAIDEGRFVDLIEVDAASKTKVDDTRELLDNVQYAPVQGRFKVYLIDEVHMLSKSSFNALLKTLEEPPEHVKFLLATTDPHKLPITVLSRCLQFNLMRLTQTQLQNHLAYILEQEKIPFEATALSLIAKSADGSARDALSILDQAIAFGAGQVQFEAVQAMLGLVDQQFTQQILTALVHHSPQELMAVMKQLAIMGVDYFALTAQLLEALHELALIQVLNDLTETASLDREFLNQTAQALSPSRVQMLYQIGLLGKQDMSLAPDERIGFEMLLLRMLAFKPATHLLTEDIEESDLPPESQSNTQFDPQSNLKPKNKQNLPGLGDFEQNLGSEKGPSPIDAVKQSLANKQTVQPVQTSEPIHSEPIQVEQSVQARVEPPWVSEVQEPVVTEPLMPLEPPKEVAEDKTSTSHFDSMRERLNDVLGKPEDRGLEPGLVEASSSELESKPSGVEVHSLNSETSLLDESSQVEPMAMVPKPLTEWLNLMAQMKLDGLAKALADQCVLLEISPDRMVLSVDASEKFSKTEMAIQQLKQAIIQNISPQCQLVFMEYQGAHLTPARQVQNQKTETQQQVVASIEQDAMVNTFKQKLNMRVIESSVSPL